MEWVDAIGWTASIVLAITLTRQVWKQWRDRSTQGLSQWLFVGQTTASALFLVYSWLLKNWVFVVTNAFLLITALVGQGLYWKNRKVNGEG